MIRWHFSLLLLLPTLLTSQSLEDTTTREYRERGIPYMQHFAAKDYNGRPDNRTSVQGRNGLMYFSNSKGILEFDSVDWRLIQLPNQGVVRTLVKNSKDAIFAGGFNEMGYLVPDSLGFLVFRSLIPELEKRHQTFGYLNGSFTVGEDVYFNSDNSLFRWSKDVFKIWKTQQEISFSDELEGKIFVQIKEAGLFQLKKDSLHFMFKADMPIRAIERFDAGTLLIATANEGLFFLRDNSLTPFETEMDAYLKERTITQCIILPNNWISVGTRSGGLVLLDKKGRLIQVFDKTMGLLSDMVPGQEVDDQGGLWLGLMSGISRLEILSPYTIFDERSGVESFVNAIFRHKGKLFAATVDGVLELRPGRYPDKSYFRKITDTGGSIYFLEMEDSYLTAAESGVYEYKNSKLNKLYPYQSASLLQSKKDTTLVYVGLMDDGLALLKKEKNGSWKDLGKINGVKDDIRELVELEDGKLWMESQVDGVWSVDFYSGDRMDFIRPEIKHYKANEHLPAGWLFLHSLRGEAVFEINGTIYKYNTELDSIMPDHTFGDPFGFAGDIIPKKEDSEGNLWMSAELPGMDGEKQRTVSISEEDGTFKVVHINDKRITQQVKKALFPEDLKVLWYGGTDGIIRQDLTVQPKEIEGFRALIREISFDGDSLVFGGISVADAIPAWDFDNNRIRFRFAAPSYNEIGHNRYRYFLEGYDNEWSDWTEELIKDYTKIPEGSYTFQVRANNIYGQLSAIDSFSFRILPPWHRSWWAYMWYVALFLTCLWLFAGWRSHQLKLKNEELEKLIALRTSEVQHQANQLMLQAEKLKELDRAKSRFFANISHEFRTPLTLIKGPVEHLERNFHEKLDLDTVKMIRRNANRLLNMVNQLLDLSRIDGGTLQLAPTEGDLYKCLRTAASSFNSHAAQRHIDYHVRIPPEVFWTSFDRDKLENIVYNLLSNAFKFSEDGSEIEFTATYEASHLQILISDTGKGIPHEHLPYIFDRFYQVDSSATKEKEGSGIGLSLSRDLIELMNGSVSVISRPGRGSLFTVSLPVEEIIISPKKYPDPDLVPDSGNKIPVNISEFKTDKRDLPSVLLVEDH